MIVVRGAGWHTLVSGMSLEKIAVGTNKDGRLEVFAIEKKTNKIYHIWQNEPNTENWNSGWTVLGNEMSAKEIAVGTNKDGRLEVFAINKDDTNKIYHIWQNEPNTENWNSGWTVLGNGMMAKEIAVQVNGTKEDGGRLEVFAIKDDNTNQVHYIRQNMLTSESSKTLNLRWWAIPANNVPPG